MRKYHNLSDINLKYANNSSKSCRTSLNSVQSNSINNNINIESKNYQLLMECSLINGEKLKLKKDLNKLDEKYHIMKEQYNIDCNNLNEIIKEKNLRNKLLSEKNNKLSIILEEKNIEIEKYQKILLEKDEIINELKEENKNREIIINKLNYEKNEKMKNIINLKENLNNLEQVQNKNMNIINKLNNEKEKLLEEIKLLEINFGDLNDKLKETNEDINELNIKLEKKEEIIIKNEEEYNRQIYELKKYIEILINKFEFLLKREKKIKNILIVNNIYDSYDIKKDKNNVEKMWNSFEKLLSS